MAGEPDDLEDLKSQEELENEALGKDEAPEVVVVEDEVEEENVEVEEAPKKKEPSPEQLELQALKNQINELTSRLGDDEEKKQLRERLARIEKTDEEAVIANFNARREAVKRDLRAAIESGDVDAQLKLTDTLTRMNAAEMVAARERKSLEGQRPQNTQQQRPQSPKPTQQANEWYLRNRGWFGTPTFRNETAYARAIDAQLTLEGLDKNSPEYFDELDKRMASRYPTLVTPRQGGKTVKKPVGSTAPAGRSASAARPGSLRSADGRLKLTPKQHQVANMLGILDDPEKVKAYEKELQASRSRDRRQAGGLH